MMRMIQVFKFFLFKNFILLKFYEYKKCKYIYTHAALTIVCSQVLTLTTLQMSHNPKLMDLPETNAYRGQFH